LEDVMKGDGCNGRSTEYRGVGGKLLFGSLVEENANSTSSSVSLERWKKSHGQYCSFHRFASSEGEVMQSRVE
jgi:hypothetical protein